MEGGPLEVDRSPGGVGRVERCAGRCTVACHVDEKTSRAAASDITLVATGVGTPGHDVGGEDGHIPEVRKLAERAMSRAVAAGAWPFHNPFGLAAPDDCAPDLGVVEAGAAGGCEIFHAD